LTTEELLRAVGILVRAGVNKIRLTGGEPTIRRDIGDIVAGLGAMRPQLKDLGITTNGLLLDRSLATFDLHGCTQLNLSLDTLVRAKFVLLSRRPEKWYDRVWRNVMAVAENPRFELKLNCVVMRGFNEDEIADFVDLARKLPIEVRFLEFMPFDGNSWCEDRLVPLAEIFSSMRSAEENLRPVPTPSTSTAKLFDAPGWRGRVGLISPMTDAFCGGCNRLRLTADGAIKNCLFGEDEWSLRDMLKDNASDEEILMKVQEAVGAKHFAHGGHGGRHDLNDRAVAGANRSMIRIGG
jgi:cyclic pyranopterin phosphate synthase